MALQLSAADLARLEAASRVLVSPLASPSVDAWRASVNAAVGTLFRGHKNIFMLPGHGDLCYTSDAHDVVEVMQSYVELSMQGNHVVHDPVVDLWHTLRRQQGVEVISWAINARMIGEYGCEMSASEFTSLTVNERGSRDFLGVYSSIPEGEVLLWILLEHESVHPFGEHAPLLLQALVPSFKAGLDALSRFSAHRATLDAMSEPVIVFGNSGIERYRNTSFVRMLEADPERDRIMLEILRLTAGMQPFGLMSARSRPASPVPEPGRIVRTTTAEYELRGSVIGPSAFDPDSSVLISVTAKAKPRLPSAGALRERFELTAREAEVALLLAEGLSNNEIAERLYLSPHTARRHTANIFDKIGVTTRKALALKFLDGSAS